MISATVPPRAGAAVPVHSDVVLCVFTYPLVATRDWKKATLCSQLPSKIGRTRREKKYAYSSSQGLSEYLGQL
jgi:hypothetical protein